MPPPSPDKSNFYVQLCHFSKCSESRVLDLKKACRTKINYPPIEKTSAQNPEKIYTLLGTRDQGS